MNAPGVGGGVLRAARGECGALTVDHVGVGLPELVEDPQDAAQHSWGSHVTFIYAVSRQRSGSLRILMRVTSEEVGMHDEIIRNQTLHQGPQLLPI